MNEERLIILKLLEQRKITETEAEQLLDALGDIEYDQATKDASSSFNPHKINLSKDKGNKHNEENESKTDKTKDFEELLDSIGQRLGNIGEQIEDKVDIFSEQLSKKVIDFSSLFADKSINFAEKIIDVIEKTVDSDAFINEDFFSNVKKYEEVIEKKLDTTNKVSLILKAYNGNISISRWDEPIIKVIATISANEDKYQSVKPILTLVENNNTLSFSPNQIEGVSIKLNVYLPNNLYNSIKAQSTNGSITITDLNCDKLLIQTKNGIININNVSTEKDTSCTTTNGKITIDNCKSQNLLAASKNGKILMQDSTITRIEGLTSNGKISIKNIKYDKLKSLSLKTTNSKIEVIGSIPEDTGTQVEASTTHGNININIPILYSQNIKNYSNHRVNAKTHNFSKCKSLTYIKAYTTNSSIYLF